jgi:predicted dehydrogenase
VLCEKPLADSLSAAEEIVEAAHASDGVAMVGFHSRFTPAAEMIAEYREQGRFGDVTHVEGSFVRRRGIPGVGSWFTSRDLSGGGSLIDIGVHLIDYALYVAGYPEPVEVSGVTRSEFGGNDDYVDPDSWSGHWDTSAGGFDVDDSASAFVRCDDGTTLSLEVSWATNRDSDNGVVLRGTEAGARTTVGGEEVTVYECDGAGVDHYSDATLSGSMDPTGHRAEVAYFLEHVAADEAPAMNTVDEALTVQRVIDAIYRSSQDGAAVRLD